MDLSRIHEMLDASAASHPGGTAIVDRDGTSVDWSRYAALSEEYAGIMRAAGVHPGDRVMIAAENCLAVAAAIFPVLTCIFLRFLDALLHRSNGDASINWRSVQLDVVALAVLMRPHRADTVEVGFVLISFAYLIGNVGRAFGFLIVVAHGLISLCVRLV